jgi:two-component system cell cycle response regulator
MKRATVSGTPPNLPGRSSNIPGKILIVEHHPDISKMLRIFLDSKGYEAFTEMNALEIMGVCVENMPDVIVLDTGLPYQQTDDIYATLRDDPRTNHIPLVFVVPKDEPDEDRDRLKNLGLGPKDAIVKLPDIEELVRCVEKALPPGRRNLGGTVLWQAKD